MGSAITHFSVYGILVVTMKEGNVWMGSAITHFSVYCILDTTLLHRHY
jgi:hypothetical protein